MSSREPADVGRRAERQDSKVLSRPPMTSRCPSLAKSSIVASSWWNLPKTVLLFMRQRVERRASEKPPKTSIRLPAAATAAKSR